MPYKDEHYGVWYKWYVSKEASINNWKKQLTPRLDGNIGLDKEACYSEYATRYKKTKYFVLSLSLQPWYKKVIDELNNYLENINIEILNEKVLYAHTKVTRSYYTSKSKIFTEEEGGEEFALPLIHYNFNDQYSTDSKFVLTHELNCFIRLLSPGENFFSTITSDPFHKDYLDNVIRVSNNEKWGHCFYEKEFKKEWFKYFDNVNLMNKVFILPLTYKYYWGKNNHSYDQTLEYGGNVPYTTAIIDHLVTNKDK